MNILIVSRSLPHHNKGGMESVAWDLAQAFLAEGLQVSVLTTAHPNLPTDGMVDGVAIRTVAASPGRYSPAWWRGSCAIFNQAYAGKIDAVLGVSAAANAIVAQKSDGARPVFVFQAHGTSSGEVVSKLRSRSIKGIIGMSRNLYWGLFKDWIYQRYDAVVSVGEAVHGQMAKAPTRYLLGATREVLIPNGIDERAFAYDPVARSQVRAQYGIPETARLMLSLSRLHVQKGVGETIAAFALAHYEAPDLRLLIAGDGPHTAALKAQAEAAGLGENLQFAGGVPRAMVPSLLSAADAFIFPTLRVEGAPINVLEALACGLPVITTPNGAASELPCQRIPLGDRIALQAAMLEARPTGPGRKSLLPEAYSVRHTAARYLGLFSEVAAKA